MAFIFLSKRCIGIGRFAMPAMNFDQPWRYPESAYEPYSCFVSVGEAVELLRDELEDVFSSMREDTEERMAEGETVSLVRSRLAAMSWPDWASLPSNTIAQVLAEESAMDLLLKLEMKYSTRPAIAQLRTIDQVYTKRQRIIIVGRAVRYGETKTDERAT